MGVEEGWDCGFQPFVFNSFPLNYDSLELSLASTTHFATQAIQATVSEA